MRRAIWILATLGVLLYLGTALAGTDPAETVSAPTATAPVATETSALTTTAPPLQEPQTALLTLWLSPREATFGERVRASGTVAPATGGEEIAIEIGTNGTYSRLATAYTDSIGSFSVEFDAVAAGAVQARAVASGTVSPAVRLAVSPVVRLKARRGQAFGHTEIVATVAPSSYSGRATIVVRRDGRKVATGRGRIRNGHASFSIPTPGVGAFWVEISFPAAAGLSERAVGAKVVAVARRLSYGSSGRDVRALRERLAELRFHVPAPSATFGSELVDSVIAFQKAYRLDRTGVVDLESWKALDAARPVRPRYRGPAHHIEVDKTRQILMEVRGGKVVAILPVSSGATGNTPEGRHQIRWKALATTTWLGPAILYRTMTFVGNSFAIHGFPSVPAYPASHGCVRIPIWAADWLYQRSPVGETVYVYR